MSVCILVVNAEVITTLILPSSSQSGWPLMKYLYLKWQWNFHFLCRCFLSSITAKTFTGFDSVYEEHGRCPIKSRNSLPFTSAWVHPRFFLLGSVLLILLVFCVVLLCVFTFRMSCCGVRYDFCIKTMFGLSVPPVVCHVLFMLFVFVYV